MVIRAVTLLMSLSGVIVGCGGTPEARQAQPSDLELDRWSHGEGTGGEDTGGEDTTASARSIRIALGEGDELRELWGISRSAGETVRCAIYGLRVGPRGLEEGRKEVGCESSDFASLGAAVSFAPVEEERELLVRRALRGATCRPGPIPDGTETVQLRVVTSRDVYEGVVAQAAWPEPYQEVTPRQRPPEHLEELWEAAMFPERYGRE
ncbi:MAG: hypothetical protein AAGF12_07920 [Myxococcota bacterium]